MRTFLYILPLSIISTHFEGFTGEGKAIFNGEHHEWVSDKWQYISKKGEPLP